MKLESFLCFKKLSVENYLKMRINLRIFDYINTPETDLALHIVKDLRA